jgi:hypothetical protein
MPQGQASRGVLGLKGPAMGVDIFSGNLLPMPKLLAVQSARWLLERASSDALRA